MLPTPKECSECGGDPVNHPLEYAMRLVDIAATPFFHSALYAGGGWLNIGIKKKKYIDWYKLFERFGLGEFLDKPDNKTLLLCQVLWEEAAARGIVMREFRPLGLPTNSFVYTDTDGSFSFESIPFPPGTKPPVWWVDTKSVMKKKFNRLGIPVARGSAVFTLQGAKKIYNTLEKPVIVKPFEGTASRHTTIHIQNEEELVRAFKAAKQVSPLVIIEEELTGSVYRPTLVSGKLVATIRRDPPRVIGDGAHTVAQLIDIANTHPKRQGPYYSHIKIAPLLHAELARQNMALESIPALGQIVNLHPKINWSVGGTTTDVTDEVHPENKLLFEEIARVIKAPIVGIDFIAADISRSWKEQTKCGVIECNGRPYFDNHHLPFEGSPRNVAGVLWAQVAPLS